MLGIRKSMACCMVLLLCPLAAWAAPIPGTANTVTLSDGPNAELLFFTINLHSEAFDGTTASDPLGVTPGKTQYAYMLEYVSGNEALSVLDVESTSSVPILETAVSTSGSVNGQAAGSIAPAAHGVVTLGGKPAARFLFTESGEAFFQPAGATSNILVFTTDNSYPVGSVNASIRDTSLSDSSSVVGPTDLCPDDPNKTQPGACGCGIPDTDSDGAGLPDCLDGCPLDPEKDVPGVCGCGTSDTDTDGDGTPNCLDECIEDPLKTSPGACGCGVSDLDTDEDGTADCNDQCPADPTKTDLGYCGCGIPDVDSDGDGVPDCLDNCPTDPDKVEPGDCGCGAPETDSDDDGYPDCVDLCPSDPGKVDPGLCGCGTSESDSDNDGVPDCIDRCEGQSDTGDQDNDGVVDCLDGCPQDAGKVDPGLCGCGVPDLDSDGDHVPDCVDGCPNDPRKSSPGVCGCGVSDKDSDCDHVPDCLDVCPGKPDRDSDRDGTMDCVDGCPSDPNKNSKGVCGCGKPDTDTDGDGKADCIDGCPSDPNKTSPGRCGCGRSDSDGCDEGCSPGYWKNHTKNWPSPYKTSDDFDATFGVNAFNPNITLLAALNREGGGVNALARQAVAALLNAASDDVGYPLTKQQVIDKVKAALAKCGPVDKIKDELERYNNEYCPLGHESGGCGKDDDDGHHGGGCDGGHNGGGYNSGGCDGSHNSGGYNGGHNSGHNGGSGGWGEDDDCDSSRGHCDHNSDKKCDRCQATWKSSRWCR